MADKSPNIVVFLPGMMCDERLFSFQAERLSHAEQGAFHVIIPRLDTATSIQGLADKILAETPSRFALCGLSMGGILAMEMVAKAPVRIQSLVLMDTNPLAETADGVIRRNRQIEDVKSGRLRQVIADEMKPHYLADSPNKKAHLDLCMDMALSLGDEVFIAQSLALRDRPDQTETLPAVRCPTLILHGREDRLCPPERHHLMQELIPHANLLEIDGAGHLPPLEAPLDTYIHLVDFLKKEIFTTI